MTLKSFTKEVSGHYKRYSNYLVCDSTIEEVMRVLDSLGLQDGDATNAVDINGNVYFEVHGGQPTLIYEITRALHKQGYADTDWDSTYTICAYDGKDSDDFTAEWVDEKAPVLREWDGYEERDEDALYDAFVTLVDKKTGAVFATGAGAINREVADYYKDIVEKHAA